MTLYEYNMRMKAYRLKQIDKDYDIHLLAWESWNVQAMRKQGKKRVPVFKTFKQFFDYKKLEREVLEGENDKSTGIKMHGLIELMKKQRERRQSDGREL